MASRTLDRLKGGVTKRTLSARIRRSTRFCDSEPTNTKGSEGDAAVHSCRS
jgi:hypothetical protein